MATVTIHQAKTNLSRLIARAEAGEEIVIARGKNAVVRLEPVARKKGKRGLAGIFKDRWPDLPDSFFFDPLPEEELRLWEGRGEDDGKEGGKEDDATPP
jgi:antitoxin (DNA-binding transcriptional repressor) of toxin-antitoxin stability system